LHTGIWWGNLREGDHLGNIKINIQYMGWVGLDWIDLAQDRDRWWALVNAVINLQVLYNAGNFLSRLGAVSF
jgi:hypothetical protein